jgi:hypothetical protein
MDSASPIAPRTAGRISVDAGTDFTFAMWTNTAEKFTFDRFTLDGSRGYREDYHRSYGEGRPS